MKGLFLAVRHIAKMVFTVSGWRMLLDGAGLLFTWVRGGAQIVPAVVRHCRIAECADCDYLEPGPGAGICGHCGCFLSVKTWVADAECPATFEADGFCSRWGKWHKRIKSRRY